MTKEEYEWDITKEGDLHEKWYKYVT